MEVQLAAWSSERLGEVLWYRNGWKRGKRSADTKWTYFFFIFTVFSNVHKGNNAANLHIPITQIQQTHLDVAAFALSLPFFFFFRFVH